MQTHVLLTCLGISLSLLPEGAPAVPSGKVIAGDGGGQGRVTFEGDDHAEHGYACDACQPRLFPEKKGSTKMTRDDMDQGRFCGACHSGKTAFGTNDP